MLIKSGLVTQISGSVGGFTGSHNRGGLYLRARAIPTDPATIQQLTMRQAMADLTAAWSTELTQTQREAWSVYSDNTPLLSPLGDPRSVGALPMYVRGNSVRLQLAADRVDDAPLSGLPTIGTIGLTMAISAATGVATLSLPAPGPWADTDDAWAALYTSRPLPQSVRFWKGPYRLTGKVEGDSVTPPSAISGSYTLAHGLQAVTAGDLVHWQARVVDELARLSAVIRSSVVVTA